MSISENKVVSIFYELTDADGNILDSNIEQKKPLSFIVGKNQIIPGLENEIMNLNQGDKANVSIKAEDAYGKYDENARQTLPAEQFAGLELQKGMTLYGQGEDGNTVQVIVESFNDKNVVIDFNHPLAGKDLNFNIEISEVRDATEDELTSGTIAGQGCGCGSHEGSCCGEHDHDEDGCCGEHDHSHGGGCGCGH